MTCACKKKHKRGSGRAHFLSGVTWQGYKKPGSGMRWSGAGLYKKRRKKKKGSGMSMTGGGFPFSGSGFPFSGGSVMRWVINKKKNGRRVI